MESLSADRLASNRITQIQAEAVSRVIGHSKQTAQKHYIMADTFRAVQNCNIANKAICDNNLGDDDNDNSNNNNNDDDDDDDDDGDTLIEPAKYVAKDYGNKHPNYSSENSRVPFSQQEREALQQIVNEKRKNNHNLLPGNIASLCLKEIHTNPAYVSIFHRRHITNTSRLRSALKHMGIVK
jgi:hypothetical protein